jgi:hypothetical protein
MGATTIAPAAALALGFLLFGFFVPRNYAPESCYTRRAARSDPVYKFPISSAMTPAILSRI